MGDYYCRAIPVSNCRRVKKAAKKSLVVQRKKIVKRHVFLNCVKKKSQNLENLENRSKTKKSYSPRSWQLFPPYDLRGYPHIATPFKPIRRHYSMSLCMVKSGPNP